MADTMEDTEFKAFCAELKKETPDMDKIKAGMEKFGMGMFTDSQRAAFLSAMFPAPLKLATHTNGVKNPVKETEKLGFQNLNGIKNALNAMQQLQMEGKVDNAQMKDFLLQTNPQTGKNVLTTVALNTWAAEFKDKRITEPEAKNKLDKNVNTMMDISETLGKLDYTTLSEAANTPDKSAHRPLKYADLAQKSFILQNALQNSKQNAAEKSLQAAPKEKTALNVNAEEESMKIGGTPLTVNPAQKPLNVNTQPENQNPEDEKDKVATLDNGGNDSQTGKNDFNIQPVEQQDIIDYMFKTFVVGGMNLGLETTFKGMNALLGAICGRGSTPQASNVAVANNQSGSNTGSSAGNSGGKSAASTSPAGDYEGQIMAIGNRSVDSYNHLLLGGGNINSAEYLAVLVQNIKNNIGKEPQDWKCQSIEVNGQTIIPFDPKKNAAFIKNLNEEYRHNPQEVMRYIDNTPKTVAGLNSDYTKSVLSVAAHLQAIEVAYQGENGRAIIPVDKLRVVNPLGIMNEMLETTQQIGKQKRLEIMKDPNKTPTPEERKKIAKAMEAEFDLYANDVAQKAFKLRRLTAEHHTESDQTKKAALKKQMDAAYKEYQDAYNKYRDPNAQERPLDKNKEDKKNAKEKTMNLADAAHAEETARNTDNKRLESISKNNAEIAAGKENIKKKQKLVEETKARTGHKKENIQTSSRVQAMSGLPRHSRRGKGGMGE